MKTDYDLTQLKIKRRGALPNLVPESTEQSQQVNVLLDENIVNWFQSENPHYQTLINQVLQDYISQSPHGH